MNPTPNTPPALLVPNGQNGWQEQPVSADLNRAAVQLKAQEINDGLLRLQSIISTIAARRSLSGGYNVSFDGERDLDAILGRLNTSEITPEKQYDRFVRDPLAKRVVKAPVDDTWKKVPPIWDGDEQDDTEFTKAWKQVVDKVKLWKQCRDVDIMAGMGEFAILFLGFRDIVRDENGEEPDRPNPISRKVDATHIKGVDDLLYIRVYGRKEVSSIALDADKSKETYARPVSYQIQPDSRMSAVITFDSTTFTAHADRVIHVADNAYGNDITGFGRLLPVWDVLDDIQKTLGGAAESTWRSIKQKFTAEIEDGYRLTDDAKLELIEQLEAISHRLTNFFFGEGAKISPISPGPVVDPEPLFKSLLAVLAGGTEIPQRKLIGSEQGQLASSQDERNWAGVINARQQQYAEPVILRPLIDRLIKFGVLPKPKNDQYYIGIKDEESGEYRWPSIQEADAKQEAETANIRATAMSTAADAQMSGVPLTDNQVLQFGGLPNIEGGDELGEIVTQEPPQAENLLLEHLAALGDKGMPQEQIEQILALISAKEEPTEEENA